MNQVFQPIPHLGPVTVSLLLQGNLAIIVGVGVKMYRHKLLFGARKPPPTDDRD